MSDHKLDLLTATPQSLKPDMVVAQDGTGKYKTINEALKEVPPTSKKTFVIHIKGGVYKEIVVVNKQMTNVVMISDGPTKTRITGGLNTMKSLIHLWKVTEEVMDEFLIGGFEVETTRHKKKENLWVLILQILQIHGGGEKMKENRHSFLCRFPQTVPNVDAQNRMGLGTT
ncbi:hypothetical protein COP2_039214 [Malus domestica]